MVKRLCALSLFFTTATALFAAEPLSVISIPTDSSFEILDITNVRAINGRTPAVVRNPPEGRYQIIFRRPGCNPLRFWMDPEKPARDILANFTLLEQWRDLNAEKRQISALIPQAQMLAQKVGPAVLEDLGTLVKKNRNTRLLALLNKFGVQVNDLPAGLKNQPRPPLPNPTSTPAPLPPPQDQGEVAADLPVLDWNEKMIDEWANKVEALRAEMDKLRGIRNQAQALQDNYTRLMTDLIDLAATDADARQVVKKWDIKRNSPPASK